MTTPGTCDGCEPPFDSMSSPPIVVQRPGEIPEVNPAAAPSVPPALVEILNTLRSLRLDHMTLVHALMKRGILTEAELLSSRAEISQATNQAFELAKRQLGREFSQRPTTLPAKPGTSNPRRSPL